MQVYMCVYICAYLYLSIHLYLSSISHLSINHIAIYFIQVFSQRETEKITIRISSCDQFGRQRTHTVIFSTGSCSRERKGWRERKNCRLELWQKDAHIAATELDFGIRRQTLNRHLSLSILPLKPTHMPLSAVFQIHDFCFHQLSHSLKTAFERLFYQT